VDRVSAPRLDGWVPIRVYVQDGRPMVDWCHMGATRFTDAFFAHTVEMRLRDPFALLFRHQTALDALVEVAENSPGVAPAGFVFHVSRCGSTSVARMLAASDQNVVLSEPPPIDQLLRARLHTRGVPDTQWATWLRALIAVMARPRLGIERRCFVKFDAWHILDLPLIRSAFPDVPWIFLHRHPVEVMVSHQREMGAQMMPGAFPPAVFGVDVRDLTTMSAEEYAARVLAAICDGALAHLHDGGLAVGHADLPVAMWTSIAEHFALRVSAPEVEAMRRAGGEDAKRPGQRYDDDTAAKRSLASAATRDAAERWAVPRWSRLEAMRTAAPADPDRVEMLTGRS
jgi:hypothetical protein